MSLAGPIVTTRAVFEFPPSESLRMRVSFESLKGTWCDLESVSAWIQLPSAASEKFIFLASSSLWADTYDFLTRSLPAKSTKYRILCVIESAGMSSSCSTAPMFYSLIVYLLSTLIMKTAWLRLEWAFILVKEVARFFSPMEKALIPCLGDLIDIHCRPATKTPYEGSSLILICELSYWGLIKSWIYHKLRIHYSYHLHIYLKERAWDIKGELLGGALLVSFNLVEQILKTPWYDASLLVR